MIAVLKPKKPLDVAGTYRPVSVSSRLYERLLYNRIQRIVESVLPKEQAGFCPGRSSQNQVVSLTEDIECAFDKKFDKKLKAGIVFVDLFAAYDAV